MACPSQCVIPQSRAVLSAVLAWLALPALAFAQPSDPRYKALEAEYNRLASQTRSRLYKQMQELRARAAQEADLSNLRAQLQRAKDAYEKKIKTDAAILAAAEVLAEAAEGRKTAAAKAMNDPKLVEMRAAYKQAEKDYDRAQFQGRLARFYLSEIRRRIMQHERLRPLRDKAYQADRIAREFPEKDARLLAAQKAIQEARTRHLAKAKDLPARAAVEKAKRAVKEAQEALAAAEKALARAKEDYKAKADELPEAEAVAQAKEAYDALLESHPGYQAAKNAAEAAQQAYKDELARVTAADTEMAEHSAKLTQAAELEKTSRDTSRTLREGIRQAERDAQRGHPLVTTAEQSYEEARQVHQDTILVQAEAEKKAVSELEAQLNRRVTEKLASDPRYTWIQEELKKLNERMQTIREQMKAMLKARKNSR